MSVVVPVVNKEVDKTTKNKVEAEEIEEVKKVDIDLFDEKKTNMASWDAYNEKLADKDESIKLVSEQMRSNKLTEVKVAKEGEEVDFTKEEAKPEKKKRGRKSKKQVEEVKEEIITEIKLPQKTKKSRIKRIMDEAVEEVDGAFVDSDKKAGEISFVDQEQEMERLQKRPMLLKKNKDVAAQNGEVS